MTKTKLLLAGLLTGAMAFGTACKTNTSTANTDTGNGTATGTTGVGTEQPTSMTPDAGTGGTGLDDPNQGVNTLPPEGTREMEPGVHDNTTEEPGTGGTGLEPEPIDRTDDRGETGNESLRPSSPTHQPSMDEDMMNDPEQVNEPKR